jgi:hypothetical protein
MEINLRWVVGDLCRRRPLCGGSVTTGAGRAEPGTLTRAEEL